MGKSTISMAIFNSFLYVYQRVPRSWAAYIELAIHRHSDEPSNPPGRDQKKNTIEYVIK